MKHGHAWVLLTLALAMTRTPARATETLASLIETHLKTRGRQDR